MAENSSVQFWWIVVFVLLALGAGIGSIYLVGGSLFTSLAGVVV